MADLLSALSDVQRECLRLVGEGESSKDIAVSLGLSYRTVDQYVHLASQTLGVSTRREAARLFKQLQHDKQLNKLQLKPDSIAETPLWRDQKAPAATEAIEPPLSHTAAGLRWIVERFGGQPHDLTKLEIVRGILWTALFAAGVLASIITIGAWLNHRAI